MCWTVAHYHQPYTPTKKIFFGSCFSLSYSIRFALKLKKDFSLHSCFRGAPRRYSPYLQTKQKISRSVETKNSFFAKTVDNYCVDSKTYERVLQIIHELFLVQNNFWLVAQSEECESITSELTKKEQRSIIKSAAFLVCLCNNCLKRKTRHSATTFEFD